MPELRCVDMVLPVCDSKYQTRLWSNEYLQYIRAPWKSF